MRRAGLLLVPLMAAIALAGCAARLHTPFLPGDEAARPRRVQVGLNEFDYVDRQPHRSYPITGQEADYWIKAVALPSVGENGQSGNLITARYYDGKRSGTKPLVIVLPIWGVHHYPSNAISAGLRSRSAGAVNVLQIVGERPLFDLEAIADAADAATFHRTLDRMVDRFVDTVIDLRRLVDWAQAQPEVDPDRIALVGFSMSALVASVALANEPRLTAGVLVMGGADPHEILAACNHEIEDARERIMARLGWSLDRFKRELEPALAGINPARFAGMVDPSRVLIIEAGADSCMPRAARERLWRAFGRPERIAYRYDHRMAFLAMTFLGGYDLQRQIYRFLDQRFAPGDALQLTQDGARPAGRAG